MCRHRCNSISHRWMWVVKEMAAALEEKPGMREDVVKQTKIELRSVLEAHNNNTKTFDLEKKKNLKQE